MSTHVTPPTAPASPAGDKSTKEGRGFRSFLAILLALAIGLTFGYAAILIYVALHVVHSKKVPIDATPASLGLQYKNITFLSREDHLQLSGWFIPGILPNGSLTAQRTIIVVHGNEANRADQSVGLLNLSGAFAHNGLAVLAFDLRGNGESSPAPRSLGLFEQRDVLGAVDFLHAGSLPYPELGRPSTIAGWGLSMGGSALLLAAAHEPAIRAIVSDSTAANYIPILEREIPKGELPTGGHLPAFFTPGALLAVRALYGIDFYAVRPVDVVAQLAPRPLFLIHGAADTYIPSSNMGDLAAAAQATPNAHVQTWLVPGAMHCQSYHTQPHEYVGRVVAFYTETLGPDTGSQ
jgi:fermentation-respiration switch protein FrsA (DUF1100 family)